VDVRQSSETERESLNEPTTCRQLNWNLSVGQRVSRGMDTALKIGAPLPAFSLLAQDRSTRALPDTMGPNLLVFYRGDW
jgi:hypothetical protein